MLAAAAAAAAAEATARDAAEASPSSSAQGIEHVSSFLLQTEGYSGEYDAQTGFPGFDEGAMLESMKHSMSVSSIDQSFQGGFQNFSNQVGFEGDLNGGEPAEGAENYHDLNSAEALNSILQRIAAEQMMQQEEQESQMLQQQHELDMQLQQQEILLQQQQEMQMQMQIEMAASATEPIFEGMRPDEHFLTVAQNGMIIGATETITGFPADSLLMTSIFEDIHAQDLIGVKAICSRFWERGQPGIEAYFRRRTAENDWVWLSAKAITYIEDPVPGFILYEARATDGKKANSISRTVRIPAMLANAVDEAFSKKDEISSAESKENSGNDTNINGAQLEVSAIPGLADDAAALQNFLATAIENSEDSFTDGVNPLQQLIETAAKGGAAVLNSSTSDSKFKKDDRSSSATSLSVIGELRSGVCLDLSKTSLTLPEVKLITLVLAGRLQIEDVGSLVIAALNSGKDLAAALQGFVTEGERQRAELESALRKAKHMRRGRDSSLSNKSFENLLDSLGSTGHHHGSLQKNETFAPAVPPSIIPPITVLNLSYTNIGNHGLEMLSEVMDNPFLKTIDIGFCGVEERGIISLARSITKRKKSGLPSIQGMIISGNHISYKAAKELGLALSSTTEKRKRPFRKRSESETRGGYVEDDEADDYDEDDEGEEDLFGSSKSGNKKPTKQNASSEESKTRKGDGIFLLHLACSSITPDSLLQLLIGLGQDCPVRELNISSNNIGSAGASNLVAFLEGKGIAKYRKNQPVMPHLVRLDLSNNKLGNDGTAKLTRAVAKRVKVDLVDLRLSYNDIGPGGIETIMNKLLQHNLISFSLDNNTIGDRGCQLIAASLPSMNCLSRLNLSFNQIGSRGITALMRSLLGCESITSLGLSGNVMKISGAIAMGFALSQHPRLAELELDNCCLSQVAQCHIAAGIISNRWVPMRSLNGFRAGPPLVAIGALDVYAQSLSNEECFRLRRDIQMKTILQWMQNRPDQSLNDFVSGAEATEAPSQSAYMRMLDWLSKVPFDEDELNDLRSYFYSVDGGEKGSFDGVINLKLRGDLLAALGSDVMEEIRESSPITEMHSHPGSFLGLSYEEMEDMDLDFYFEIWNSDKPYVKREDSNKGKKAVVIENVPAKPKLTLVEFNRKKRVFADSAGSHNSMSGAEGDSNIQLNMSKTSMSSGSIMSRSESERSQVSLIESRHSGRLKPRIAMFPAFAQKLETVRSQVQEYMDNEDDPAQQDVIAQLFAEASLTLLRQLKYHCMNSGLDGWRQGKIRRKVLIVDDSMVTRKMVSRAFEKANFIVDTAENGAEGVEKLKESIYDIAFMDIDMPVMNGFDATKELRDWEDHKRPGARQPICALTAAYVDDFEREELMKFKEAGLDVMESKPCNIPRLFKVVDDVSPMFSDLSISVSTPVDPALPS